ncbi:MAG TPA: ATP-binding protein [Actinomycetota bacterium]|nr:ATP-binding protein [Actinomycetota bacterium]
MKIVRTLNVAPTAPGEARRSLVSLDRVIPSDRLDDLRIMVSELVTNSVMHSGLKGGEPISLLVKVLPERVRVEVADPGRRFPDTSRRPRKNHGRGLMIIDRLADRWGTERGRQTKVWAEIPLPSTA